MIKALTVGTTLIGTIGAFEHGAWIRFGSIGVLHLVNSQVQPLFSERNRIGVSVLPLGFGWRLTWRRG